MHTNFTPQAGVCDFCDAPLQIGPLGPQCMHCLLSLGAADEAFADVAELFPELHIHGAIAHGGFGSVFRAEQRRMKRPVALKFLDTGLKYTPEAVALFEREMVTVASLSHPGIVQAYDAGDREGQCYIVMEMVDGEDCGALVRHHKKLPVAESCEIVRQAALALDYAHGKGLVHRDVKPGNIMVSRESPMVKVLDFGLAGIATAPDSMDDEDADPLFFGTLEYIAPEQIEAPDRVDARADVYALGATLRRLLTGQPVREGMSELTLLLKMKAVTSTPAPPIAELRPDLPGPLAELCDRMLALAPDERPQSGAEVASLIAPWCAGAELARLFEESPLPEKPFVFPKKKRRLLWLTVAAACIATVVAMFFHDGKMDTPRGSPVFSEKVAKLQRLDSQSMPRLLSEDWKVEREFFSVNPSDPVKRASLRPDGTLIYVQHPIWIFAERTPGGDLTSATPPGAVFDCVTLGVQPGTGDFVWARHNDSEDLVILRHRADGTALSPLAPDFSGEASEKSRAAMRAMRRARGDTGGYAYPWGFAFVTEATVPPNAGLRPGDVLYADEGHRDLSLFPKAEAKPGIWKFRFDTDDAPQRVGALSATWEKGLTNFPIDVAVSGRGVFLLNRTELVPGPDVVPSDTTSRILRWDKAGFHPCETDRPISRPAAIAADPLTADLYVVDGGSDVAPGDSEQRVLRLRPDGVDKYKVEVFARGFVGLSYCGLQITDDGQRMVFTDERLAAAVVLLRRGH